PLPPDVAAQVAGGVQADPEDPRLEVAHLVQAFAAPPALQKRFLSDVVSVVAVAQQRGQRSGRCVAKAGKRLGQLLFSGRDGQHGGPGHARTSSTSSQLIKTSCRRLPNLAEHVGGGVCYVCIPARMARMTVP